MAVILNDAILKKAFRQALSEETTPTKVAVNGGV